MPKVGAKIQYLTGSPILQTSGLLQLYNLCNHTKNAIWLLICL